MPSSQRRRVAVTGLGAISPAGSTLDQLWSAVHQAHSKAAQITAFDASDLPVRFACEVPGEIDTHPLISDKESRRLDRFAKFAVLSAMLAYEDAGGPAMNSPRAAVVAGAGSGGALTNSKQLKSFFDKGAPGVHPLTIPMAMANAAAAEIAIRLGCQGPNLCIATACASGGNALGEGLRLIRDGSADMVLAGASEASVTPFSMAAFANLKALSARNEEPGLASRPFDIARDGFVMGEGGAFCVLEEYSLAEERGARIYGEFLGYGRNCDAYHVVMPSPGGARAAECMHLALADANMPTSAIAQINAHGTSTPLNDAAEASAIREVFGSTPPPVTATKGVLGHMVAAAGAIEFVVSCLSLAHQLVPPTANFLVGDDDHPLPIVTAPLPMGDGAIISNSFGFGGHNAALVVGPPAEK